MRWILFIALLVMMTLKAQGQKLTDDMISSMVALVDDHIELTEDQENSLLEILRSSYAQVMEIQNSKDPDVVKLRNMALVQENADKQLKGLLSAEQYEAYHYLLNGEEEQLYLLSYSERVEVLANDLKLNDQTSERFIEHLTELEASTQGILVMGTGEQEVATQLLTEILVTDIELIRLMGRDKYSEFFNYRANGALSDVDAGGSGSVEQVLMFADLVKSLELTSAQTRQVIGHMLENEARLQSIRDEYRNSPPLMQEKLRLEEQKGLIRLQEILSEEQVESLLQLLGQ